MFLLMSAWADFDKITESGCRTNMSARSDCTRRPSPGLCSLTGLEAVLGRRSSTQGTAILHSHRSRTSVALSVPGAKQTPARLVPSTRSLAKQLISAAAACRVCDLWKMATQTVFGEGPKNAAIMFVGEQPGDLEDRSSRPFVGPGARYGRSL